MCNYCVSFDKWGMLKLIGVVGIGFVVVFGFNKILYFIMEFSWVNGVGWVY